MSKNNTAYIGAAIVLLILVIAFVALHGHRAEAPNPTTSGALPSGTSTTDTSLNQDTAAIDTQLKGLDQDSATIDQGLQTSAH